MLWKGRRQSDNVEDMRGSTGGGGFGGGGPGFQIPIGRGGAGGGLSGIVILVILFFVLRACGIDPLEMLNQADQGGGGPVTQQQSRSGQAPSSDETTQFVRTVLAETEDTWTGIFQSVGKTYEDPKLVLFSGQVRSACGFASAASGPFYCPNDRKVYLDTAFFQELSQRFGASGDFAQAYVIAHEVGHHVQNLLGILPKTMQARQQSSEEEANRISVATELQADCFAGVWGHFTDQKGILEKGDVEEALNAAQQIGDDTLQKRSQGYVVPDSFTHGSSAQRVKWFNVGFQSGKLADCDTFSKPL